MSCVVNFIEKLFDQPNLIDKHRIGGNMWALYFGEYSEKPMRVCEDSVINFICRLDGCSVESKT